MRFRIGVALTAVGLVLTGCGGGGDATADVTTAPPTSEVATASAPSTSASAPTTASTPAPTTSSTTAPTSTAATTVAPAVPVTTIDATTTTTTAPAATAPPAPAISERDVAELEATLDDIDQLIADLEADLAAD